MLKAGLGYGHLELPEVVMQSKRYSPIVPVLPVVNVFTKGDRNGL